MGKEVSRKKWHRKVELYFENRWKVAQKELKNEGPCILQELSAARYRKITGFIRDAMKKIDNIVAWNSKLIGPNGYEIKLKKLGKGIKCVPEGQLNAEMNYQVEKYIKLLWNELDIDSTLESYHTSIYDSNLQYVQEICKNFGWTTENVKEKCFRYIHKLYFFLNYLDYAQDINSSIKNFDSYFNTDKRAHFKNHTTAINKFKASFESLNNNELAMILTMNSVAKLFDTHTTLTFEAIKAGPDTMKTYQINKLEIPTKKIKSEEDDDHDHDVDVDVDVDVDDNLKFKGAEDYQGPQTGSTLVFERDFENPGRMYNVVTSLRSRSDYWLQKPLNYVCQPDFEWCPSCGGDHPADEHLFLNGKIRKSAMGIYGKHFENIQRWMLQNDLPIHGSNNVISFK